MLLGAYATDGSNFGVFTIPGSDSKITLYYQASEEDVDVFIQFKESGSQVAGLMNYASGGGHKTISDDDTKYSVGIQSGGKDISVSFMNLGNSQTSLSITYEV